MSPESVDPDREGLLRHREFLENSRLTTSRDRDKLVLAMAGGSLTVSVTLLERVASNIGSWQVALLLSGWAAEVLAIILVLRSLSSSERALEAERGRVDVMLSNDDGKDPEWPNLPKEQTESLNAWAAAAAIIGIALILAQAGIAVGLLRR